MREWNGDVQGEDSVPTGKKKSEVPANAILVFKMKHKTKQIRTLQEDLRIAARKACRRRNRTVDDEYQLVGDRCNNDNPYVMEESSQGDSEKPMSDMIEICKKNAADLYNQEVRRQKKLEKLEQRSG